MDFQRSRIQPRTKIETGDDAKHDDVETERGVDFWKKAPEDVLLEIFIRCLPNYRSAIRTSTVCRNWHSLISKNPLFIPRFAILFRIPDFLKPQNASPQYLQPICKLFSEELMLDSPNFLDFNIPSSSNNYYYSVMVIRGSCNDLLLISPGSRGSKQFYICNPFTKQFIQLPQIPRSPHGVYVSDIVGHALVCMPPGPTNKFRFKVVEFKKPCNPRCGSDKTKKIQSVMMFCSESRKWETRVFHYPQPPPKIECEVSWLHVVACKGVLYWLEFARYGLNRVIYLDLSKHQCGAIDFPDDYCHEDCLPMAQIGVVHGEELRLLQVILTSRDESTVYLKVWKLIHDDQSDKKEWVLVHHKNELKKPNPKKSYHAVPFVHPTNGDVVFIVWGQEVFQYNLKDTNAAAKTYELMGKLERPEGSAGWKSPRDMLLQFPVVHTHLWPTQILT